MDATIESKNLSLADVQGAVLDIVAEQLEQDRSTLSIGQNLIRDLGTDELAHTEICLAVCEKFGLEYNDLPLSIDTVGDLAAVAFSSGQWRGDRSVA